MRASNEQLEQLPEMVEMRQRRMTVSVSNQQENDGNDEGVGMASRPTQRNNVEARLSSMADADADAATSASPSRTSASARRYLDFDHASELPGINDGNSMLHRDRPPSVHSIPLQRARSHGRESILEMDLADAAMEPASAAEMADPGLQERERRRMRKYNRRLRRTPSVNSRLTKRTVRHRAGEALKAIKARTRRDSSSSSSSSDGSSSSSSGSSSSTGINWRFWRPSSASTVSDDSYIPPEPTFTLFTPRLANSLSSAVPSEQDLVDLSRKKSIPHPYTSKSSEQRDQQPGIPASAQVFDILPSTVLAPCLDKLREFWLERDQQEGLGGDVGEAHTTPLATPALAVPSRPTSRPGLSRSKSATARHIPEILKHMPTRQTENAGPAWWLDVQCPSPADMRQLRRVIPLHPLTMEDILAQETREKIETHEALGYYFIAFRALDETYFRYTEVFSNASGSTQGGASPSSSETGSMTENKSALGFLPTLKDKKSFDATEGAGRKSIVSEKAKDDEDNFTLSGKPKKWKVEIVEGAKEGVEGVGVGALNIYFAVFGDGIISFHFDDISNHINRVRDRIQQFGLSRSISSHWIAYGLMDSIVDNFFPLIEFIETESDDIDEFLANPLSDPRITGRSTGVMLANSAVNTTAKPRFLTIQVPAYIASRLPSILQKRLSRRSFDSKVYEMQNLGASALVSKPRGLSSKKALRGVDDKLYDRGKMLHRIATARKIITAMSRMLGPKMDVVRGLRKRVKQEFVYVPGHRHDINIYLGDLQDHIITMQQTLTFFDTMLSHDHPAYLGILRLAYEAAKIGNDKALVRLTIVAVTFLPITIFTGAFSLNVQVPHNGVWGTPLNADGTPAAYNAFGLVIVGLAVIVSLVMLYVYWAFRDARQKYEGRRL